MRHSASSGPATRSRRRILLIVDFCQIGDTLRIASYVRAVRAQHPTAHITLLVSESAYPVFAGDASFDRIVQSRLYFRPPRSSLRRRLVSAGELLRLLARLGTGYDLVISCWWGTTMLDVLAWLAGRGERMGYAHRFPRLLTSRLGPFDFSGDYMGQQVRLMRAAGIEVALAAPPSLRFSDADEQAVAQLLAEHGLAPERGLVVCHPGSDWACQQWLPERWSELADALAARYEANVIFTGVAGEAEAIERIRGGMRAPSVSLVGRTTLPQLAALLARARLCVCVDSAVFELAQAIGAQAVVLAGPSRPERVNPGRRLPVVLNPMAQAKRETIDACRGPKDIVGRCLDYSCPLSGLREITVPAALTAVEGVAAAAGLEQLLASPARTHQSLS